STNTILLDGMPLSTARDDLGNASIILVNLRSAFTRLYRLIAINIPDKKIGQSGNKSRARSVSIVDGVVRQTGKCDCKSKTNSPVLRKQSYRISTPPITWHAGLREMTRMLRTWSRKPACGHSSSSVVSMALTGV